MLDTSNTQSFDDFKIFFTLANLHSTVLCKMFEVFKRKDVSKYKYGFAMSSAQTVKLMNGHNFGHLLISHGFVTL